MEPQTTKTPVQTRIDAFLKDYGEIVKKYEVDFAQYPMYVPDGTPGGFKTIMQNTPVDIRNAPTRSPFIP